MPSRIPYGAWIMDATGGMVACGFGHRDEQVLLNAWRRRMPIWQWFVAGLFAGLAVGAIYVTFSKGEDEGRG